MILSKIRYINRQDLDVTLYDSCIEESGSSQIYALSWYLDTVADFWDVLVYDDYQAVMPIPFLKLKRHFFSPKIYVPPFVQQLGIFGKKPVNQEIDKLFVEEFIRLHPKQYAFNAQNHHLDFLKPNLFSKPNFELNLQFGNQILFQNYSQNLQRNLKKTQKSNLKIESVTDVDKLIDFQTAESDYCLKKPVYNKLRLLYKELEKKQLAEIYKVTFEEKTVAMALMLFYQNRIINLLPVSNEKGKQLNAMAFLLGNLIEKHAGKPMVFDFEGSSVESIARFYKGFGAVKTEYSFYQKPFLFTSLRWYFLNKK